MILWSFIQDIQKNKNIQVQKAKSQQKTLNHDAVPENNRKHIEENIDL